MQIGQPVLLQIEGLPDAIKGTLSRISPSVNIESRTFQIEAVVHNSERKLRPGSFVRASILVGIDPSVAFVPRDAVISFAGLDKVYSIKDGKAVEHVVTLGPRRGERVAVVDGLGDAESAAVTGLTKLSNGVPVSVSPLTKPNE